MFTYNHEKFIGQAIESVIMQEVDFDLELVIGEDFSTDRTREIVESYHRRYPGIIRLILQPHNIGANRNCFATLDACKGEYIALLEGDDFWTSPNKLQNQADYLDAQPACALCFHRTLIQLDDETPSEELKIRKRKPVYTLCDYLDNDVEISTCSTFYRRALLGAFPPWFRQVGMLDVPIRALLAQKGDIGFLDEVMGVYRIHAGGIWSVGQMVWASPVLEVRSKMLLEIYEHLQAHLAGACNLPVRRRIAEACFDLVFCRKEQGDLAGMRKYLLRAWKERIFPPGLSKVAIAKTVALAFIPGLFALRRRFLARSA
jgi:hypothetical protein